MKSIHGPHNGKNRPLQTERDGYRRIKMHDPTVLDRIHARRSNNEDQIAVPEMNESKQFALFRAFSVLENRGQAMSVDDRNWFGAIRHQKPSDKDKYFSDPINARKLLELYEKYKESKVSVYKPIVPLNTENVAKAFGNYKFLRAEDIQDVLAIRGLEAIDLYENQVGNWKPVPLLTISGKRFVLKKVDTQYLSTYRSIQDAEHRPNISEIVIAGQNYGLFEFKGDTIIDFTNKDHLTQLCDIAIASARRGTMFDNNQGNLLIDDGRLFYIDVGLTYGRSKTPLDTVLANIESIVNELPKLSESSQLRETISFIVQKFSEARLDVQPTEGEDIEQMVRRKFAPFFNEWNNESKKSEKRFSQEFENQVVTMIVDLFAIKR